MKSKATLKAAVEVFYGQNHYKVNHIPRISLKMHQEDKKCVQELDMDMIVKMFEKLPPKIVEAKKNGLESLF